MPMNAKELKQLYSMTTDAYSEREPFTNTRDNLIQRIQSAARAKAYPLNDTHAVKIVDMYLEAKLGTAQNYSSHAGARSIPSTSSSSARSSRNTSSWWSMPSFSMPSSINLVSNNVDNSWNMGNTTNINQTNISSSSSSNNTSNKKDKKSTSAEAYLMQIGIIVIGAVLAGIAAITLAPLCYEISNHISRIWNNEGTVQGSLLLMGVATSYCLAMFSIYEIAGGLIMGAMMAASFANPAAWAAAAIAIIAVIALPVFNMVIRESIYSVFSLFDNQALVSTDNRFRMLTQAEEDNLHPDIDVDRVNFATLCKYDELKPSQTRQRFAFFDYNTDAMNRVLGETRAMRHASQSNSNVPFSLFKQEQPPRATDAPSAPTEAQLQSQKQIPVVEAYPVNPN
mgnify:CR=1 FL=1|tara:strand:+ start:31863 stop:33050 length:1188 start_codon:yes stop_codon:yes gene_type:complete